MCFCWWLIMLSTSYSNKRVSWVCYLTLQINITDTINRWIQLVTCGDYKTVICELHLVFKMHQQARLQGCCSKTQGDLRFVIIGNKKHSVRATSRMSLMKDLTYIRSTFFFLRDASGCSSFTGTVETCLFLSDVLPHRGTNLWRKNNKKAEWVLILHFKQFDCIILSRLDPDLN